MFSNISISLEYPTAVFFIGIILIILYTLFIYKNTLPKISLTQKSILVFLRSITLILLLWLMFNPIIIISEKEKVVPKTLVFFDNSKSVSEFTENDQISKLNDLYNSLRKQLPNNTEYITFGEKNDILHGDSLSLNFNEKSTRLDLITERIKKEKLVSSVIIISDGIFNNGEIEKSFFRERDIRVYTVGIGDSTIHKDVNVESLNSNKIIYTNRETEIEIVIKNTNAAKEKINLQLLENNKLIDEKQVTLDQFGLNRINFLYTPKDTGKVKLSTKIIPQFADFNSKNNVLDEIIDVLPSKKIISIFAGAPGKDLSILLQILDTFEDFEVKKFIEISKTKYSPDIVSYDDIEKSDLLILLGYPSVGSNQSNIQKIKQIVELKKLPLLIILSNSFDFQRAKELKEFFPFALINKNKYFTEQVYSNKINILLSNPSEWENLPPVQIIPIKFNNGIIESILISTKSKLPVVSSVNNFEQKFLYINAANIWRWKLTKNSNYHLDNLLLNSIKWLTVNNNKERFIVKTSKNSYNVGENIRFNANLYDETYEPIPGKKIIIEINNQKHVLVPNENGNYSAEIFIPEPGKYTYRAQVEDNTNYIKSGEILINPIEIELLESSMNKSFMKNISDVTDGKYLEIDYAKNLIKPVNEDYNNKIYVKKIDKELRLSNFELILIFIVLLFSTEWILRKLFRML